jgi:Ni,Fe-hydrogenase I small subunit
VNGTSSPKLFAIAIAIAVFPVPGCPAINIALPAILPYLIIVKMIPAAFLA